MRRLEGSPGSGSTRTSKPSRPRQSTITCVSSLHNAPSSVVVPADSAASTRARLVTLLEPGIVTSACTGRGGRDDLQQRGQRACVIRITELPPFAAACLDSRPARRRFSAERRCATLLSRQELGSGRRLLVRPDRAVVRGPLLRWRADRRPGRRRPLALDRRAPGARHASARRRHQQHARCPARRGKSVAVWTCSGGGAVSTEGPQLGVSVGGPVGRGRGLGAGRLPGHARPLRRHGRVEWTEDLPCSDHCRTAFAAALLTTGAALSARGGGAHAVRAAGFAARQRRQAAVAVGVRLGQPVRRPDRRHPAGRPLHASPACPSRTVSSP